MACSTAHATRRLRYRRETRRKSTLPGGVFAGVNGIPFRQASQASARSDIPFGLLRRWPQAFVKLRRGSPASAVASPPLLPCSLSFSARSDRLCCLSATSPAPLEGVGEFSASTSMSPPSLPPGQSAIDPPTATNAVVSTRYDTARWRAQYGFRARELLVRQWRSVGRRCLLRRFVGRLPLEPHHAGERRRPPCDWIVRVFATSANDACTGCPRRIRRVLSTRLRRVSVP